jgi:hypothetical protein
VTLRAEYPHRLALALPHRRDVQQHVRYEAALLRLVRFEAEHRRRADHLARTFDAGRLGEHPGLERDVVRGRVVPVVRVGRRVRQHHGRLHLAVQRDQAGQQRGRLGQRVVPRVEVADLRAQHLGGLVGLGTPVRLDVREAVPLAPQARGLAALAEAHAPDHDPLPA